jgi:hypothetical protein
LKERKPWEIEVEQRGYVVLVGPYEVCNQRLLVGEIVGRDLLVLNFVGCSVEEILIARFLES